jgi:hypothetical protein
MCKVYKSKGLTKCLRRLTLSLDHVRSFTLAISSATQADTTVTLVWGELQIVIEINKLGPTNMVISDFK